jgi:acyl-CoA thioester hydrolase
MKHQSELRVRFSDTDMLGHVNNAAYFTYMEESRVRLMEDMEVPELPLILASAKVDFRAQTFYTDTLLIETWISRIGNTSFDVANRMLRKDTREVVFEGVAVIVYFDYETQRPAPVPSSIREKLNVYMSE